MNAFIVFSAVLAAAQAGIVSPFAYSGAYASPYAYGAYGPAQYAGAYAPGAYAGAYSPAAYAGAYSPAAYTTGAYAPAAYAAGAYAPATYAGAYAPYAPSSQFQAQDEFGNVNYGYANINSAKQEVGNAYGGVTGSYSYVDANGIPQRTDYIADGLGFRVKATNLPVGPAVPDYPELKAPLFDLVAPVFEGKDPEPVQDTKEVMEARAAFMAAFEAEKNREKRSDETPADTEKVELKIKSLPYALPYAAGLNYAASPLAYGYSGLNYGYSGLNYGAYNGLYNGAYNGIYNRGYNGIYNRGYNGIYNGAYNGIYNGAYNRAIWA